MPVQEEVIPYLLGNRNDVIALAQTGTGKTAAFGIPILQRIDARCRDTQALVLSPTRELCLQIADDLKDFSKYMGGINIVPVYGGASIEAQVRALKRGVQVIVATPGRLIDLKNRGVAKLGGVSNVVLDEADEMLNMGFADSINEIFESLPAERNTLLFSATMSKEVEKIALTYLHNHKEIVVGSRNEGAENVNHVYYMVNARDKYLALKRIVDFYPRIFAIIFCRTKRETQEIADKLINDGYNAESLHGDLSQQQRDLTMQKFRNHLTQLLVATDVAARGLDVDDLTHVINYGMPDDIESYTHRSGRTGRAGKKGTSIAIIHSRERSKIRAVEKEIGKKFVEGEIPTPEEICTKQLYRVMDEILKVDVNEEEIAPFMAEINRHFEFLDKEDIIKKIVSREFGRFINYYANAPVIEKPGAKDSERKERRERKGRRQPESGFRRLFINLGKDDGFYPGEVMQFINRNVDGHPRVGHIDLGGKFSYFEVAEEDAESVMEGLNGARYHGREVRCNDADEPRPQQGQRQQRQQRGGSGGYGRNGGAFDRFDRRRRQDGRDRFDEPRQRQPRRDRERNDWNDNDESGDWRQFFNNQQSDSKEEGWARRRPKKK